MFVMDTVLMIMTTFETKGEIKPVLAQGSPLGDKLFKREVVVNMTFGKHDCSGAEIMKKKKILKAGYIKILIC